MRRWSARIESVALRAVSASVALAVLASACSSRERPPAASFERETEDSDAGPRIDDDPPSDGSSLNGLCGNQIINVVEDRPNLYFVIDRSGSMTERLSGSRFNKYMSARIAIAELLRSIGHRVQYGAGVYPAHTNADNCGTGSEVFETQPGDAVSYAKENQNGPVLSQLLATLGSYQPVGGTPTSATLEALAPELTALEGETVVILATDGAPNCNADAACGPDECMPNVAGASYGDRLCDDSFNCCDPEVINEPDAALNCVDTAASELAVSDLARAGIRTFVVGMPGSELFAGVLNRLALAGQTALEQPPFYYQVTDVDSLSTTLKTIGTTVAITCDIELDEAPPDPRQVNVYFDGTLVPSDADDGWIWQGEQQIQVVGPSCELLLSGEIFELQVAAGCTTVVK